MQAAVLLIGSVLVAEMTILACSKKSYSNDNGDSGDAGDDGDAPFAFDVGGGGIGDGSGSFESSLDETGVDGGQGPCALPNGSYTVTATPTEDSGPNCPSWTATIGFPPTQEADGAALCLGGPGAGYWNADGELPACTIDFTCSSDNGENTTQTSGSIVVLEGSYAGTSESQVYSDLDASVPLYTCVFHLDYASK
jgi:hypothetical protein